MTDAFGFENSAAVRFQIAQPNEPMAAYYDGASASIVLTIGTSRDSLLSRLSLEFYFLHEYLSHIGPNWDDSRRSFSEAYLFRLAHWFYRRPGTSLAINPVIVDLDWRQHRSFHNPEALQPSYWDTVCERAEWFRDCCGSTPKAARLFLDWARYRAAGEEEFPLQFLGVLREIYRSPDPALPQQVEKALEALGEESTAVQAYEVLSSLYNQFRHKESIQGPSGG